MKKIDWIKSGRVIFGVGIATVVLIMLMCGLLALTVTNELLSPVTAGYVLRIVVSITMISACFITVRKAKRASLVVSLLTSGLVLTLFLVLKWTMFYDRNICVGWGGDIVAVAVVVGLLSGRKKERR